MDEVDKKIDEVFDNIVENEENQILEDTEVVEEILEVIDVNDLKFKETPKLKMLKVGEKFDGLSNDEKIMHYRKLASALNTALEAMQNERNDLLILVNQLEEKVKLANDNAALQKSILINSITQNNEEKQKDAVRIGELMGTVAARDKAIDILNEQIKVLESK